MKSFSKWCPRFLCVVVFIFESQAVFASTPAEMAELSLQQLLELSTSDNSDVLIGDKPWSIGILYSRLEFDGYLDGSSKVSNEDVLFRPGETRTNKNFPVLPTVITQEAFIINTSYQSDDKSSYNLSIPIIKQSTNHNSIVAGYSEFNIISEGIGDISANFNRAILNRDHKSLSYSIGLSIPTGSIDKKGDTPRAPGEQQLPYTMQLGSGTWDIPAGIHYQQREASLNWGLKFLAKFRLGKNDRNYRLGNRYVVSAWVQSKNETLRPLVKLTYQYWEKIHGQDNEITVPGVFPYPAGITNPDYFGGKKLNLTFGLEVGKRAQSTYRVEVGAPVYQSLNGVQLKEVLHLNLSWNTAF